MRNQRIRVVAAGAFAVAAALAAAACEDISSGSGSGGSGESAAAEETAEAHAALTITNPPTLVTPPNPPNLYGPQDGFTLYMANGVPMRTFTWDPPIGGTVPTFYSFWLEEVTAAGGGFKTTPVQVSYYPGRTSTDQLIPLALADKPARWYVAACMGTMPTVAGPTASLCGRAASRSITWSTRPLPPGLYTPADGARVEPGSATFTWWGVSTITSYRFCAARTGTTCPEQPTDNGNVLVVSTSGTSATVNLTRFRGQTISWTAAACDNAGRCSYQVPRSVRVDEAPPALSSPASGATVPSLPTLTWTAVSWAEYYLVCAATPGTSCLGYPVAPGTNSKQVVVRTSDTRVAPNGLGLLGPLPIDLYQFRNTTVSWTVAACVSGPSIVSAPYCSWQTQARTLQVVPEWWVGVTLDRLDVHDDCDSVSPGDWRVAMAASAHQGVLPRAVEWKEWPTSNDHGSRDVDSGSSLDVGQTVSVTLRETDTLTFATAAIDCDNDGIWTLANVWDGIEGVWNTITNWTQTCGGEEWYESSGSNDVVGTTAYSLGPASWMGAQGLALSALSPGGHDCGSNPYTARFTVTAVRR